MMLYTQPKLMMWYIGTCEYFTKTNTSDTAIVASKITKTQNMKGIVSGHV